MPAKPLYRRLELNFHTQYAEAKERARTCLLYTSDAADE